ncbi:hypothetical protein [Dyadobacter frigoris]|uniref:Lamin tail domain-containing protein n=1 Tax=Dyadobacter frigoris TaxID=2576211 RepID=A0A4U6DBK4_9BACT|nr:hypothetical protein [Dyadobacter frigoris]TKT94236.1 hypothetical protein FDK13_03215 [Dyadobacter frigoris]
MKPLLLLVLFIGCSFSTSFGQHQKLLYNSSDIGQSDSLTIKTIRGQQYSRYVKVFNRSGTKIKIPKDSLWGFTDRKGHIYRFYKKLPYRVVFKNDFVKYIYNGCRFTNIFYSKSPDSEMVRWKRNL